MACSECDRREAEYARLEQACARAVNTLNSSMGTLLPTPEYMCLRAAAEEARIDSEVARIELEQHKRVRAKAN
jgi:hypothetical protein